MARKVLCGAAKHNEHKVTLRSRTPLLAFSICLLFTTTLVHLLTRARDFHKLQGDWQEPAAWINHLQVHQLNATDSSKVSLGYYVVENVQQALTNNLYAQQHHLKGTLLPVVIRTVTVEADADGHSQSSAKVVNVAATQFLQSQQQRLHPLLGSSTLFTSLPQQKYLEFLRQPVSSSKDNQLSVGGTSSGLKGRTLVLHLDSSYRHQDTSTKLAGARSSESRLFSQQAVSRKELPSAHLHEYDGRQAAITNEHPAKNLFSYTTSAEEQPVQTLGQVLNTVDQRVDSGHYFTGAEDRAARITLPKQPPVAQTSQQRLRPLFKSVASFSEA